MSLRAHFEDAFRLLALRTPLHVAMLSPAGYLLVAATIVGIDVIGQWFGAGAALHFQLYGVNAELAGVALAFALILLFASRDGVARRNLALVALASAPLFAIYSYAQARAANPDATVFVIAFLALVLWLYAANWRAFAAARAARPALRSALYTLTFWLAMMALPNWPIFPAENFSRARANFWEAARASASKPRDESQEARIDDWRKREAYLAEVEAAQPARLEATLAALTPRDKRKPNIYAIGVAGYGDQDVFQHEIDQSMSILKDRLGLAGHVATLVNNPNASDPRPLASLQNLAAVLRGVAQRMDRDKDALILNMTSHGSTNGFALENEQLVYRTLSPQMLKSLLDAAGVKYRALIISACHSGVFTKAFNDPGTLVITAAAEAKTSFGCASGREWTYFGEAFFDKGFKETGALAPAFEAAKTIVGKRESDEKLTPSEPQIFIGDEFRRRFPALVGATRATEARLGETPKTATP